jgi:hypothetical protein
MRYVGTHRAPRPLLVRLPTLVMLGAGIVVVSGGAAVAVLLQQNSSQPNVRPIGAAQIGTSTQGATATPSDGGGDDTSLVNPSTASTAGSSRTSRNVPVTNQHSDVNHWTVVPTTNRPASSHPATKKPTSKKPTTKKPTKKPTTSPTTKKPTTAPPPTIEPTDDPTDQP